MKKITLLFSLLLLAVSANGQQTAVAGKVVLDKDSPVIGALVVVMGDKDTVRTDSDGAFIVIVNDKNDKPTLIASADGFETAYQKIKKDGKFKTIKLKLQSAEVAVIGGFIKKEHITSASSSIDNKDYADMKSLVEGRAPGVVYEDGYIRIRGNLCDYYLVDGVRVPNLSSILPTDVKTIEVLKDGTTNIYGLDAANGVVRVTTKSK